MTSRNFQKLINKNKYQVFLFFSPANIPFSFFSHPWFVLNNRGIISRWEVLFRKNTTRESWGHLHKNFLPPFLGIRIFPFFLKYSWQGKLLGFIEGNNEQSVAKRMIEFIEDSKTVYPYCQKFILSGPNSNSYAQWILNNFPEFKVKLSWNAFGKNYKIK